MWTGEKQTGDLAEAIAYFHSKLPGWWFSVGSCHVSADATCAPDSTGCDWELLKDAPEDVVRYFDSGFDVDLLPPATMADALRLATNIAWTARDTYYIRRNLADAKQAILEQFGVHD